MKGATLLLVVAEPGPTGTPNLNTAQQVILTRASGDIAAQPPPKAAPAAPLAGSGAGGSTKMDRRMIQLLTANAWCAFSYSGSQTYSSSNGTSQGDGGSTGRWRFDSGVLSFSADGVTWQPAAFKLTFNSNGSPIPVVGGKEYRVCN